MAVETAAARSPWRMLSGERTVVFLFVFRLLSSLPLSLFPHGLALSLLSVLAMFVEIRAEDSSPVSPFKTRPGASSGIMLGAVTLPTVTLSKLVQLSRALSLQHIERGGIEHLTMQYWSTSICCFGVLIFLCMVMRNTPKNKNTNCSSSAWVDVFSSSSILLYVAFCCVSLASISCSGFNVGLKWLWLFGHGIAAVKLIQYLLNTFPACSSFGWFSSTTLSVAATFFYCIKHIPQVQGKTEIFSIVDKGRASYIVQLYPT